MARRRGYSWKRATGITNAKRKVSRATGIPLTKSGRKRKIKRTAGCATLLIPLVLSVTLVLLIIL